MSVNTVPRFIEQPKTWVVKIDGSTPFANPDGTGTLFDLITGGRNGSKADLYIFHAEDATVDSRLMIFLETANSTTHLLEEIVVSASSAPGGGTPAWSTEHVPTQAHQVPENWKIRVGADTNELIHVFAIGGDY